MRKWVLGLGLLALMGAVAVRAAEEGAKPVTPTEKIELFNGQDLSDWNIWLRDPAGAEPTFKVEGGLIKCSGAPFGYLRTKKAYANYKVTVEWRYLPEQKDPKAINTGLFIHASGPDKVWPKALECQGKHGDQGNFVAFEDVKFAEMKGKSTPRTGPDAEKPMGEWNVFQAICDGDSVTVMLNGKQVNKATQLNVSSGNVCLQSEGGAWECRKVTLEPVKAAGEKKAGKKGTGEAKKKGPGKKKKKQE